MAERDIEGSLARRLPWLLVFRGFVGTAILVLTLAGDIAGSPVARLAGVLYGVAVGTFFVVFLLGLLLRSGTSAVVVATVHLATAVAAALMVVQATGGVASAFTFLYLLVILDGAIVGSRRVALAVASVSSILYGTQAVLQLYDIVGTNLVVVPSSFDFASAVVTHIAAFYLMALLAGRLAGQFELARAAVTVARTEVRALEADLRKKERLASIGQMAAAIAHEIRNPLAAISGAVELMGSGGGEDRPRLEAIVLREIARLNRLVDDFLVYARPARPQRTPVSLPALVEELSGVLVTDPAWMEFPIRVTAAGGGVTALDAAQVRQLLWNLLRNAREASPPGTTIEVAVEPRTDSGAAWVAVTVTDRGAGLSPEARAHLFEPFFTTKSQGTGLGLAIVQRIVEAHDGRIRLSAAEGGGTTAEVLFPLLADVGGLSRVVGAG